MFLRSVIGLVTILGYASGALDTESPEPAVADAVSMQRDTV